MRRILTSTLVLFCAVIANSGAAEQFTIEKGENSVTVNVDGKLFTRYLTKSGNKPILWPLIGPTGKEMTRGYPMRDATPEEKSDHIHHRSLWFTHGNVNNVDFWSESPKAGTIQHREFLQLKAGDQAQIVARNDWVGPDGKRVCQEESRLRFGADPESRWIDFDIIVTATDGPLTFGDTKEGSFGVRVNETIKVDAKKGGSIVNSEGQTDGATWGKPAAWVDYYGPVSDEVLGIAILNHPTSFGYPVHWHVRTYGLFAANPFGLHDFSGSKDINGDHTIAPKGQMTLRFRVVLHKGDHKQGKVVERFQAYAQTP